MLAENIGKEFFLIIPPTFIRCWAELRCLMLAQLMRGRCCNKRTSHKEIEPCLAPYILMQCKFLFINRWNRRLRYCRIFLTLFDLTVVLKWTFSQYAYYYIGHRIDSRINYKKITSSISIRVFLRNTCY